MPALLVAYPWAPYAIYGAHLLLEYWLGRTDKVKAGSTIELVLNGINALLPAGKKPE